MRSPKQLLMLNAPATVTLMSALSLLVPPIACHASVLTTRRVLTALNASPSSMTSRSLLELLGARQTSANRVSAMVTQNLAHTTLQSTSFRPVGTLAVVASVTAKMTQQGSIVTDVQKDLGYAMVHLSLIARLAKAVTAT